MSAAPPIPDRPAADRLALVRELIAGREAVLQACWAQQAWGSAKLATADGQPLRVVFPGWLNRGAGPDFTDARVRIGASEHQGDVEIHLDEQDWRRHAHDQDPGYGRVVLHVILTPGGLPAAQFHSGAPIPVFVAAPHLSPDTLRILGDPEQLLRRYETLPGRCGLRAARSDPAAVEAVIAHAAEARARQKAERLDAEWPPGDEEQLLYELIFQALGYRPYAPIFRDLARRWPLAALYRLLEQPPEEARRAVLARWFGALGLLEGETVSTAEGGSSANSGASSEGGSSANSGAAADPEAEAERRDLAALWRALGEKPTVAILPRGGARPQNSPQRRMVGCLHHLLFLRGEVLKGWLRFLRELDALRDQPEFRRRAHDALAAAFATPAGEPWRARVTYGAALGRDTQLIGEDRVAVILANAVVPFFLAYARRRGDAELEKVLYRLFLVLPGEGPNWRTRFMTQRLMPLKPLPRTLRTQQGLIQVHQDFCTSFESGCGECRFPDLIGGAKGQG